MRLIILAALAAPVAIASPSLASPFDGTWKAEVESAKLSQKPDVFAIKDGVYSCSTCTPPLTVAADGKMNKVAGRDYWDAISVTVVDANTVRYVRSRGGKIVGESTDTVSADGQTLTTAYSSNDNAAGKTISGTSVMARVAAGPAGSHAVSGSWRATTKGDVPEDSLVATLAVKGNSLTMSFLTGESYTAVFGGPAVPMKGDPGKTMVRIKRLSPTSFEETDTRRGKPVGVYIYTVTGPTTMTMRYFDPRQNTTSEFKLNKQ